MIPTHITTATDLPGRTIVRNLGIVRGITVRSRSIVGTTWAGLQTLFGGNITAYTNLCEVARIEAYDLMVDHAERLGADAVVAMRYDANEIAPGVTEVLCYGTAVMTKADAAPEARVI